MKSRNKAEQERKQEQEQEGKIDALTRAFDLARCTRVQYFGALRIRVKKKKKKKKKVPGMKSAELGCGSSWTYRNNPVGWVE
jgi:hypothetical protein